MRTVIEDYNSILFEYRNDGIITQLCLNFLIAPSPFNVFVVRIEVIIYFLYCSRLFT